MIALHSSGRSVTVTTNDVISTIAARPVLLITGVRESSRAQRLIGGTKPGGVLSTGALQCLVHLEDAKRRRSVILCTEVVFFSTIMTCAHVGIRPVAIIEPNGEPTARWQAALYSRLEGIPLHLSTQLVAIEGRD